MATKTPKTKTQNNLPSEAPEFKPDEGTETTGNSIGTRYKSDFTQDLNQHDQYVLGFDPLEAMLVSQTYDDVSKETSNGITDGATTTIYLERSGRVVGQVPSGVMRAAGKKDAGKAELLDTVLQKYIIPNANAQYKFLAKQRMWQFYSSVYGFMIQFVDHHVAPTGYIGPDTWLISPRNFVPQSGRSSIRDMDYCHTITDVTATWIADLIEDVEEGRDDSGWDLDNLKKLYNAAKNNSLWEENPRDSFIARQRQYTSKHGQIPLVTRFETGEKGQWVSFVPYLGYLELRKTDNPHKTNRLPFFKKSCIPLFDSFYDLGDFQRSMPIQFAKDGLTNFYFEGIKMNIYPPTVVNANGVIKHTVDMSPGSVIQETQPNSVRRLETSTAGLSTYQAATTQMQGALQGLAGTTNTTLNAEAAMDPQFGKTPQALQMLAKQESTRDNLDRFYFEQEYEDMINYMLQVYINCSTEQTTVDLFSGEIADIIAQGYTDVLEMLEVNGKSMADWLKEVEADPTKELPDAASAKLKVKPSVFKDLSIDYQLDDGTSKKEDNEDKKAAMDSWLGIVAKMQNELQTIRNQGEEIDWKLIFTTYGIVSNVPNMDKIFKKVSPQEQQQALMAQAQQTQATAPVPQPHVAVRLNGDITPDQELNVAQQQGFASPGASPGQQPQVAGNQAVGGVQGGLPPGQQPVASTAPSLNGSGLPSPFRSPEVAAAHTAMMSHPLVQALAR